MKEFRILRVVGREGSYAFIAQRKRWFGWRDVTIPGFKPGMRFGQVTKWFDSVESAQTYIETNLVPSYFTINFIEKSLVYESNE